MAANFYREIMMKRHKDARCKYTIPKRELDETVDCRLTLSDCTHAEFCYPSDDKHRFAEKCKSAIREVGKINFETSVPGTYIFTVNLVTPEAPIRPHPYKLVGEHAHKCGVLVIEAEVESSIEIPLSFFVARVEDEEYNASLEETAKLICSEANFDPICPGGLAQPTGRYHFDYRACRLHAVVFRKCAKSPKLRFESESKSKSAPESASVGAGQSTSGRHAAFGLSTGFGSVDVDSVLADDAEAEAEPLRTAETCSTSTGGQSTTTTGSSRAQAQTSRLKDVSPEKLADEIHEGGHRYEAVYETVSRILYDRRFKLRNEEKLEDRFWAPQHSSIEGEEDMLIHYFGHCVHSYLKKAREHGCLLEAQFCSDSSFSQSKSLWFETANFQIFGDYDSAVMQVKIPRYTGPLTLSPFYADNKRSSSSGGADKAGSSSGSGSGPVSVDAYNCADVAVYVRFCVLEPIVQVEAETKRLDYKYECITIGRPKIFTYHAVRRTRKYDNLLEAQASKKYRSVDFMGSETACNVDDMDTRMEANFPSKFDKSPPKEDDENCTTCIMQTNNQNPKCSESTEPSSAYTTPSPNVLDEFLTALAFDVSDKLRHAYLSEATAADEGLPKYGVLYGPALLPVLSLPVRPIRCDVDPWVHFIYSTTAPYNYISKDVLDTMKIELPADNQTITLLVNGSECEFRCVLAQNDKYYKLNVFTDTYLVRSGSAILINPVDDSVILCEVTQSMMNFVKSYANNKKDDENDRNNEKNRPSTAYLKRNSKSTARTSKRLRVDDLLITDDPDSN